MKQIYTTTLRLNLADEDDRRAYEHLQRMDKKQYLGTVLFTWKEIFLAIIAFSFYRLFII